MPCETRCDGACAGGQNARKFVQPVETASDKSDVSDESAPSDQSDLSDRSDPLDETLLEDEP